MKKTNILIIFIACCLLAACKLDVEHLIISELSYNGGLDDNDKKPFTTKEIPVTNGLNGSSVTLRFYEDMGDVAYISVSDYHKMMTGIRCRSKCPKHGFNSKPQNLPHKQRKSVYCRRYAPRPIACCVGNRRGARMCKTN